MHGDFEDLIGMPNPWVDEDGKDHYFNKGLVMLILFVLDSLLLITSIIKTIIIDPGTIPENKEWDMLSDALTEKADSDFSKSEDEFKKHKEYD